MPNVRFCEVDLIQEREKNGKIVADFELRKIVSVYKLLDRKECKPDTLWWRDRLLHSR
jgi:hypothetical protein